MDFVAESDLGTGTAASIATLPASCDVLVIGGGPAGSTAAATLSREGVDVVCVEKERHPRFHIGESLLPRNLEILERLGVLDEVMRIGVHKPGAEFVSDVTGKRVAFPFARAPGGRYGHAYQVRRSDFDELLFRNAARSGARCFEETEVVDIDFGDPAAVRVSLKRDGRAETIRARFVLDASGRDTFMANRIGRKTANKHNTTAAVFAHYRDVERRVDVAEGYISIHLVEDGWFWLIPLQDGVTSVGFVGDRPAFKGRSGSIDGLLAARIAGSPTVSARMARARREGPVRSAGNYSYASAAAGGERFFMIGDAFAFIDPVFSSGVLLATSAAEAGARVARAWLKSPEVGRKAARVAEAGMRRNMAGISWLIYRINDPVARDMFMNPSDRFGMRDGIVSILAGNLSRSFRANAPVVSFKLAYALLTWLDRLGIRRVAAS